MVDRQAFAGDDDDATKDHIAAMIEAERLALARRRELEDCACKSGMFDQHPRLQFFFLEGGAMNFIEKSAITTKAYWLRVYRSCPNFAQ